MDDIMDLFWVGISKKGKFPTCFFFFKYFFNIFIITFLLHFYFLFFVILFLVFVITLFFMDGNFLNCKYQHISS